VSASLQLDVAETVLADLERDGIVILHDLMTPEQLRSMRTTFETRLQRLRWNDFDGYEKTEPYRHMVQDVLTLDQGFVDLALHPLVKGVLRSYIGEGLALAEAKGWLSLPTMKDFHGWHGDAWYDQTKVSYIPREVKVAMYLTDVRSGAFMYAKGTQGRQAPRGVSRAEAASLPAESVVSALGPAGTVILFDTSGIHRQSAPILEPRQAVFLNYHDLSIPLQQEDIDYYRYHPLLLNAAFLGGLDAEDYRILGFGNKAHYVHAFQRKPRHEGFQGINRGLLNVKLRTDQLADKVTGKVRKLLGLQAKPKATGGMMAAANGDHRARM
jgi:hypothetical protein